MVKVAADFVSQSYKDVALAQPKAAGDCMKSCDAIVYRIVVLPRTFQTLSTIYMTALETFEPVSDYDVYKLPNTKPEP
jgi:hypothetical protein